MDVALPLDELAGFVVSLPEVVPAPARAFVYGHLGVGNLHINVLGPEAEAKINELNAKLARKEYESGLIYMKMDYFRAATVSFDYVLEKYHDTPYAEPALLKKGESPHPREQGTPFPCNFRSAGRSRMRLRREITTEGLQVHAVWLR